LAAALAQSLITQPEVAAAADLSPTHLPPLDGQPP
jgi:hypothetical protein